MIEPGKLMNTIPAYTVKLGRRPWYHGVPRAEVVVSGISGMVHIEKDKESASFTAHTRYTALSAWPKK